MYTKHNHIHTNPSPKVFLPSQSGLVDDLELMFANAETYNEEASQVTDLLQSSSPSITLTLTLTLTLNLTLYQDSLLPSVIYSFTPTSLTPTFSPTPFLTACRFIVMPSHYAVCPRPPFVRSSSVKNAVKAEQQRPPMVRLG